MIVSVSVDELLTSRKSLEPTGAVTVAVFDSVPLAVCETVPMTVNVAIVPDLRVTVVAMSPLPLAEAQLPFAGTTEHVQVADWSAAGSVSVTSASVTSEGPLLVTLIE